MIRRGRRLVERAGAFIARFDRKRRWILGAGASVVVVVLVVVVAKATGGNGKRAAASGDVAVRDSEIAARARSLLDAGQTRQAAVLLQRELADHPTDGTAYLVLGHAQIANGHPGEGLAAYSDAIRLVPAVASDAELNANVRQAMTSALPEVRHKALEIAERGGIADASDHLSAWALDLRQAKTCDEREAIIQKLASTHDRRALPALRETQTVQCVARDATAAIHDLDGSRADGR